ncbi:expressed unknown protein [Seminavis robusta]|uniref:Uncharacterized protein n=1 Tax=Seminavis robusta TaxID=568900 RepID=A0A9N8DP79_9STRA|nr:expressed unknown protein [Seminavis robusta]|eukprot:Sro272_g104860.1 n/a (518) ;mRNA; f:42930-44483
MPIGETRARLTTGSAALRGLCFYLAGNFVYVHWMVFQDWSKDNARYIQEVEVNPPELERINADLFGVSDLAGFPSSNEIESLLEDIKVIPQRSLDDKVVTVLEEYSAFLSNATTITDDDDEATILSAGSQAIERLKLGKLLQSASLSKLSGSELENLFKFSLSELQGMVRDKKRIQWDSVRNILVDPETPFPEKEIVTAEDLHDSLCVLEELPELTMEALDEEDDDDTAVLVDEEEDEEENDNPQDDDEEEDETADLLAQYAQEEDLESMLSSTAALLEDSRKDPTEMCQNFSEVSSSVTKGKKQMEEGFTEANGIIENASQEENERTLAFIDELEQSPNAYDDEEGGSSCPGETSDDDVRELVEAGLNALKRHEDVRPALLNILKQVDPDAAENLILDADFRTEAPLPTKTPVDFRLRALVDSPLLRNFATSVDKLLDIVSGYYDPLDQKIDQLTERLVVESPWSTNEEKNLSSLGGVFVSTVWEWSGQIAIPIPQVLRAFLEKRERGRALLAFLS